MSDFSDSMKFGIPIEADSELSIEREQNAVSNIPYGVRFFLPGQIRYSPPHADHSGTHWRAFWFPLWLERRIRLSLSGLFVALRCLRALPVRGLSDGGSVPGVAYQTARANSSDRGLAG